LQKEGDQAMNYFLRASGFVLGLLLITTLQSLALPITNVVDGLEAREGEEGHYLRSVLSTKVLIPYPIKAKAKELTHAGCGKLSPVGATRT
jgi:hypothetical protein